MYYQYSGRTWTSAFCLVWNAGRLSVVHLTDEEFARVPVDRIVSHDIVLYEEGMYCLDIVFPETDLGPRIGMKASIHLDEDRPGARTPKLPPVVS